VTKNRHVYYHILVCCVAYGSILLVWSSYLESVWQCEICMLFYSTCDLFYIGQVYWPCVSRTGMKRKSYTCCIPGFRHSKTTIIASLMEQSRWPNTQHILSYSFSDFLLPTAYWLKVKHHIISTPINIIVILQRIYYKMLWTLLEISNTIIHLKNRKYYQILKTHQFLWTWSNFH
jgi:hypothetical protein